jgi:anti-sigma factor RsiW
MEKHVVEPEELQAYLDGELEAARRAEVERHLSACTECSAVVRDLQQVSQTLQRWQVEPAPASLPAPWRRDRRSARQCFDVFSSPLWRWRTLAATAVAVCLL